MRVVWTDRAKARLRQIPTYIAQDQPINAERMVDRLTHRVAQLAEHPRSGRIVEKYQREDLRELIEAPYRIVYLIGPDRNRYRDGARHAARIAAAAGRTVARRPNIPAGRLNRCAVQAEPASSLRSSRVVTGRMKSNSNSRIPARPTPASRAILAPPSAARCPPGAPWPETTSATARPPMAASRRPHRCVRMDQHHRFGQVIATRLRDVIWRWR